MHTCKVSSAVSNSLQPYGPLSTRLLCLRDSLGKKTGVDCHVLLQGIFPHPGIEPASLIVSHIGRRVLYHQCHLGNPQKKGNIPVIMAIKISGLHFVNVPLLDGICSVSWSGTVCLLVHSLVHLLLHSFKKHLRPSACSYCPRSHYPAEKKTRVLSSGAYILVRCKDPGAYILKILPGLTSWQEAKPNISCISWILIPGSRLGGGRLIEHP